MLRDAASIAGRARSGTVLTVSVQCHRAPDVAEADRELQSDQNAISPEERFKTRFKDYGVDPGITRADLGGWAFGRLSRTLLLQSIQSALEIRRLSDPENAVTAKEICSFEYEDGAKMTTLVIALCSEEELPLLQNCKFEELDFLQEGKDAVYIPTPKLTIKEFRQLEKQLPLEPGKELEIGFIPPGEAKGFAQMYRYFPNFAVVET